MGAITAAKLILLKGHRWSGFHDCLFQKKWASMLWSNEELTETRTHSQLGVSGALGSRSIEQSGERWGGRERACRSLNTSPRSWYSSGAADSTGGSEGQPCGVEKGNTPVNQSNWGLWRPNQQKLRTAGAEDKGMRKSSVCCEFGVLAEQGSKCGPTQLHGLLRCGWQRRLEGQERELLQEGGRKPTTRQAGTKTWGERKQRKTRGAALWHCCLTARKFRVQICAPGVEFARSPLLGELLQGVLRHLTAMCG